MRWMSSLVTVRSMVNGAVEVTRSVATGREGAAGERVSTSLPGALASVPDGVAAVSYTHLTLPTILLV